MLQQDLLDTLFLNRKALADVGGGTADKNAHAGEDGKTTTGQTKTTTTTTTTTTITTASAMRSDAAAGASADACPVDHKSREAWLAQARAAQAQETKSSQPQPQPPPPPSSTESKPTSASSGWGWRIPFFGWPSSSSTTSTSTQQSQRPAQPSSLSSSPPSPSGPGLDLGESRVVSTIPRSTDPGATSAACPVNHETETGADAKTGNWVYPSEKMFFDAMKRKGHDTRAADMKTVVPIHNAVNERAWVEIKQWEAPYATSSCPNGPMLYSFTGLSSKMSPKARLNTLVGYTAPFDRHDWVVDRCGTKVEYVIDFYTGKIDKAGRPSFYLDVRPKLNTWEGVRMRAVRALGLV